MIFYPPTVKIFYDNKTQLHLNVKSLTYNTSIGSKKKHQFNGRWPSYSICNKSKSTSTSAKLWFNLQLSKSRWNVSCRSYWISFLLQNVRSTITSLYYELLLSIINDLLVGSSTLIPWPCRPCDLGNMQAFFARSPNPKWPLTLFKHFLSWIITCPIFWIYNIHCTMIHSGMSIGYTNYTVHNNHSPSASIEQTN